MQAAQARRAPSGCSRDVVGRDVGAVRDIGPVRKISDGLSREIFGAEVEFADGRTEAYVVALPSADADPELRARTLRERALLARLRNYSFPFRLPEVIGVSPEGEHVALVRAYAYGVALDLRAGRQPAVQPWQVVGEIAASIHAVPGEAVADVVDGTATRNAHARAALAIFEGCNEPEMRDGRDWALAHLPPAEPSVLLHGDLLGQNILLAPERPPTVIDWEYARRGDPAHDLAIVTRGARRPFQIDDGLARLLEAYHRFGGCEIEAGDVHLHELCLIAGWYRTSLAERSPLEADQELNRIRSLLRRLR